MCSSCLANHVTPATPVTETKNCLYISRHTPLFGALVGFCCARWDLGPSALEIKLPSCLCITMVDLLSLSVGSEIRAQNITHTSKCSKFSKPGFNSTGTVNFQMFKWDLEKAEEPEIKLSTSVGSSKKQESSKKKSIPALLTTPKPLTVWTTTNCGNVF